MYTMMKVPFASRALIYYLLFSSYFCLLLLSNIERANAAEVLPEQEKSRKLAWYFVPTGKVVDNNNLYDDYDDRVVPTDKSMNDAPDFLRSTDSCYKDGSYSLSSCPKPPDCNVSGKFGPAKLCINRAPRPDNGQFYVLVMKCIPQWENCDKCLCGYISSDKSTTAKCAYTPGNAAAPDDDNMKISCNDLTTVKFQNFVWKVVTQGTTNSSPTLAPFPNTIGLPIPIPNAGGPPVSSTQTLFQSSVSSKKYKNSKKGVYKNGSKSKASKSSGNLAKFGDINNKYKNKKNHGRGKKYDNDDGLFQSSAHPIG